jgi:hypothetical protein
MIKSVLGHFFFLCLYSFKRKLLGIFRKFRIVSVHFETVLFVSVVSINVRNTETNRKIFFLVSRNKPKQTRNRSCFGLFRFEPKNFIFHFEDTLVMGLYGYAGLAITSLISSHSLLQSPASHPNSNEC